MPELTAEDTEMEGQFESTEDEFFFPSNAAVLASLSLRLRVPCVLCGKFS